MFAGQFRARPIAARHRDPRDLVEAEGVLGGGEGALLGAEAEAVAGVFHVGAGDDLAVDAFDRAADREAGVGGVGLKRGGAGGGDQFFVVSWIF